jgi:hypothetical protein
LKGQKVLQLKGQEPSQSRGKAQLSVAGDAEKVLKFWFNPTSYSVSKTAKWNRPITKGKDAPSPEYAGIEPAQVQMELLLDTWVSPGDDVSKKDITAQVGMLLDWLKPTAKSLHKKKPQPPVLAFTWGSTLSWFFGYLKSLSVKYTMFRPDGTPTRATATISLEEVPHGAERQNPTSGGVTGHRTRVTTAGDSLQSIAHQEYGNPGMWRKLAELNGIDDPLRVAAGTTLFIADDDDLEPAQAGEH